MRCKRERRSATDKELYVIAKILGVPIEELFNKEK
jgi:hypothetical protein